MSATKVQWNPVTHPYRVSWFRHTSAAGCYGWASTSETFSTKEEACAAFEQPMKAGVYEVQVDYAENGGDWQKKGYWQRLDSRKRKPKPITTTKGA